MSIVKISIANRIFELQCPEDSKEHILQLAEMLDNKVQDIQTSSPAASFELALVMTALNLQDEKNDKLSESGGAVLAEANKNHQQTLTAVNNELNNLLEKIGV